MAEFDEYGRLIRRGRPDLPNTHYTPTYNSASLNWWDRLDNFVIDIGNWFADNAEDFAEKLVGIAGLITVVCLGIWVISVFTSEGILMGILAIIGAVFIGGIIFFAIGVLGWLMGICLLALRFIFYNIYTLLIALAIGLFFCFGSFSFYSSYSSGSTPTELYKPTTTTYVCTARSSLKVRNSPSLSAATIGSLYKGEEVEVYEISNGFAHIKYRNGEGYASIKYLRKK